MPVLPLNYPPFENWGWLHFINQPRDRMKESYSRLLKPGLLCSRPAILTTLRCLYRIFPNLTLHVSSFTDFDAGPILLPAPA